MSQEEMDMYKHYTGIGAQRLSKRKRSRSSDPGDIKDRPSKRLAGDTGVVVEHCEHVHSRLFPHFLYPVV
jgi:mRNA (guanine-N7-)-methyltransferase